MSRRVTKKRCFTCQTVKPVAEFNGHFYPVTRQYRTKPDCKECDGSTGLKKCLKCDIIQPVEQFHQKTKASHANPNGYYIRRTCKNCLNEQRSFPAKNRTRAERRAAAIRSADRRAKRLQGVLDNPPPRPAGWTPPPSEEELIQWYRNGCKL